MQRQATAIIDAVERAHRQEGGERLDGTGRGTETGRFERGAAESSPDVVHVAARHDGRLSVRVPQDIAIEQSPELHAPLEFGESEVAIDQDHRAGVIVVAQPAVGRQRPTPFLERNCQFEVPHVGQGKPAQDRVTVRPFAQPHVGLKRAMGHRQRVADPIDLPVMTRSRHAVVDLLQEYDVRLIVRECFDDPLRPVSTVDAADALMDVVGYESKVHVGENKCEVIVAGDAPSPQLIIPVRVPKHAVGVMIFGWQITAGRGSSRRSRKSVRSVVVPVGNEYGRPGMDHGSHGEYGFLGRALGMVSYPRIKPH